MGTVPISDGKISNATKDAAPLVNITGAETEKQLNFLYTR
jgi:hypothetical protein